MLIIRTGKKPLKTGPGETGTEKIITEKKTGTEKSTEKKAKTDNKNRK